MNREAIIPLPRERTTAFVLRMANAVGAQANASAAFGPPVSQNGTTMIPVATSIWGFGAGRGEKKVPDAPAESGLGGGGGGVVRPAGYLVVQNGKVTYTPMTSLPALLFAGLVGAALASWAARRRHRAGSGRPAYEW